MTEALGTNIDPKPAKSAKPTKSAQKPDTVKIVLEENDDIPPTGLFLGHNGTGYLLKPGEPVEVPRKIIEILDNAVMSAPQMDPATKQIVGYRDRMRYPYRVVNVE